MSLFNDGEDRHTITVPVNIVALNEYEPVDSMEIIFGRKGIFSEFDVEFKERKREIIFKR